MADAEATGFFMKKNNIQDDISLKDGLFLGFSEISIAELENKIALSESREEKVFYRALINLKMQFAQEKVIGAQLL